MIWYDTTYKSAAAERHVTCINSTSDRSFYPLREPDNHKRWWIQSWTTTLYYRKTTSVICPYQLLLQNLPRSVSNQKSQKNHKSPTTPNHFRASIPTPHAIIVTITITIALSDSIRYHLNVPCPRIPPFENHFSMPWQTTKALHFGKAFTANQSIPIACIWKQPKANWKEWRMKHMWLMWGERCGSGVTSILSKRGNEESNSGIVNVRGRRKGRSGKEEWNRL